MSKQREAMQFALETLEDIFGKIKIDVTAINMLREALAEQKPLTEQQILELLPDAQHGWTTATYGKWVARAIERAHGITE